MNQMAEGVSTAATAYGRENDTDGRSFGGGLRCAALMHSFIRKTD